MHIDLTAPHLPPLATAEARSLAGVPLEPDPRSDHAPEAVIDLRDQPVRRADDEHVCPFCGARAQIDIHDPMRGRIHLSCGTCFKMWQERVEVTKESAEPYMRD